MALHPSHTFLSQRRFTRRIINISKYIIAVFIIFFLLQVFHWKFSFEPIATTEKNELLSFVIPNRADKRLKHNITLAITMCGNSSFLQGISALKSALILSNEHLHFVVMSDKRMFDSIEQQLNKIQTYRKKFTYELHQVKYPTYNTTWREWRKLFKECASLRLFLPKLLLNYDSVLYIDTDVLFLSPVEDIWSHFDKMDPHHIAGMSSESEEFSNSWYHRFSKHPYYGSYGLNSGVMLMNLTRMRNFDWTSKLEPILRKYRNKIIWGDQDIINIIFHFDQDKLYLFECNWNYRTDHCAYTSVCKNAARDGIKIVHGNRGVFLNDREPIFKAVFQAFERYDEKRCQNVTFLVEEIQNALSASKTTSNCNQILHLFWESVANQSCIYEPPK